MMTAGKDMYVRVPPFLKDPITNIIIILTSQQHPYYTRNRHPILFCHCHRRFKLFFFIYENYEGPYKSGGLT